MTAHGTAFDHSDGYRESATEMRRLQMLNEISRVVSSTLDLRTLYNTMYEQISRIMDTSMFFIALTESEGSVAALPYVREFGELSLDMPCPATPSVTNYVFERGKPLLFHTNEQYRQFASENGLPAIVMGDDSRGDGEGKIYVPLNTGSRTIGTLSVQSINRHAYTDEDLATLSVIASQAAIAIENARLYSASVMSARRLQTLLRVAQALNSTLDLKAVLDAILTGIGEVVPYYLAAILLPTTADKGLESAGVAGILSEHENMQFTVPSGKGITGRVFSSGAPILVADALESEDYIGPPEVRSVAAVPLIRGDAVIGVLDVKRLEPNGFSENDLRVLTLFASQAAVSIENARLFAAQQSRMIELHTIQSIVQEMTGLHEAAMVASVVDRELRRLIEFDNCHLFRLGPDGEQLETMMVPPPWRTNNCLPFTPQKVGDGLPRWVAQNGRAVTVANSLLDSRTSEAMRSSGIARSIIAAPLLHEGKVTGVIALSKLRINQFDENALRVLGIIGAQTAIALDRCRLYEELRIQAVTDDLTGLFNRRWFDSRLIEERSRSIRNHHPLAALMMDIDDFKGINDTYGHDCGDEVLRGLGKLIRNELRAEDIVARYGGEEFCLLLPEVHVDGAAAVADRLRGLISASRFVNGQPVAINVSIGIALLEHGDRGAEMVSRADQAMYAAKRAGGNTVCVASNGGRSVVRPKQLASGGAESANRQIDTEA
jgi:diguanylate cyclase (GGDEF)-like protein